MQTHGLPDGFGVGDWRVHPSQCRLTRDDRTVQVRPKVMDLLVALAKRPGIVISKDALLEDVWGTEAVSESALTRTVTELRQALGDSADTPRILETIPKRGYRLLAAVSPPGLEVAQPPAVTNGPPPRRIYGRLAAVLTIVTVMCIGAWLMFPAQRARLLSHFDSNTQVLPFAARDWVLVVPFENRSGEAMFDGVIEQALERELLESGFVNVVPKPRVEDALALMKRPPDSRLDAGLAREVALRDGGIRAILSGRISRVETAYVLSTSIVNPANGATLATVNHHAERHGEVLPAIRRQALDVRRALGEAVTSIERSRQALAKVTTPSLQALQLYSKAADLLGGEVWRSHPDAKSRYASAEALLTQATTLDPSFASAWLLRAKTLGLQDRGLASVLPLAEKALLLSADASTVERYFIEGFTHALRGRDVEDPSETEVAARSFEAVLQLAPDHYWTMLELEWVYRDLGRFDDLLRMTIHGADVRPRSLRLAIEAARAHLRRGDRTQARTMIERARRIAEENAGNLAALAVDQVNWLRLWEAHEAWLDNDPARALAAARRIEHEAPGKDGVPWLTRLAYVYGGLGRYDDALRVCARLPEDRRPFFQAYLTLQRGRMAEFSKFVPPKPRDFDLFNRHLMQLVWSGRLSDAEWAVSERRRRGLQPPWSGVADQEGQLRVRQGRYAEGLAMLLRLKKHEPFGPRNYVSEHIALAYRGLGNTAAAILELERLGERRVEAVTAEGWQVYSWLRCRVLLAELYQEAGRPTDAERVASEVRGLLAVGEPDHPLLKRVSPELLTFSLGTVSRR